MKSTSSSASQNSNSHKDLLLIMGIMVAMIITITAWLEQFPDVVYRNSLLQRESTSLMKICIVHSY